MRIKLDITKMKDGGYIAQYIIDGDNVLFSFGVTEIQVNGARISGKTERLHFN